MVTEEELYERIFELEEDKRNLQNEIEHLKQEIEEILQDRDDNYKPIEKSEQYDVHDNMFI